MTSIKPTGITDYRLPHPSIEQAGSNETQMPEERAIFVIVMAIAGKQDAFSSLIKTAALPSKFTG